MKVLVTLVVLNSADTAVFQGGLIKVEIKTRGVNHALVEALHTTGVTNHGSPKLVMVRDGDRMVEIIYRVRTQSRQLADHVHWQSVARNQLNAEDRWIVEEAMRSERP